MTLHLVPEQISLRPSRRNIPTGGWVSIDLLSGAPMLVYRTRFKTAGGDVCKVWLNSFEYLAVMDEVDELWMGRTPAQLDLDPAGDELPDYRREPEHDGDAYGGKFL